MEKSAGLEPETPVQGTSRRHARRNADPAGYEEAVGNHRFLLVRHDQPSRSRSMAKIAAVPHVPGSGSLITTSQMKKISNTSDSHRRGRLLGRKRGYHCSISAALPPGRRWARSGRRTRAHSCPSGGMARTQHRSRTVHAPNLSLRRLSASQREGMDIEQKRSAGHARRKASDFQLVIRSSRYSTDVWIPNIRSNNPHLVFSGQKIGGF
jgi:hypothetical protein